MFKGLAALCWTQGCGKKESAASLRVGIASSVTGFVVSVVSDAWSLKHVTTATMAELAGQPGI